MNREAIVDRIVAFKADRSFKRSMLITWGMRELAKGRSELEVRADISRWMKKTVEEVKAMTSESSKREAKTAERIVASYAHVAFNPMRGLHLDRGFYIPDGVDVETITPEGTDLDVRVYEKDGVVYGVAFAGRANKPLWNYRFRDRAQMKRRIDETVENRKGHIERVQQRQQERREFKHGLKVDDILYSSWGYDQTNIDFYQVIETGEKSVVIRKIDGKTVGGSTGSDLVVADPGHFSGPPMTKIVRPGDSVRITSYASAYKWDGRSLHETAFGYGH